ncbi:hypothetical protein Pmani_019030 [Petrolisthes manimaculis]|uniref:ZAD domain-containing protein n=1 Tax=Petrolisthes manimaculis TaxID=1843537 RepID=A0AAE1U7U6_9EUCA|nr:hypothetical protein Pmani_019030 [Petrolisthes manimaculis]
MSINSVPDGSCDALTAEGGRRVMAGQQQRGGGGTRGGSNMCLVCGRRGGNSVLVTSVHSFVSASGTPLSDFLVKVVGEDPCYSVSEVVCQQCFVLLDRLDAYQARAAEIHTHLTTRYRDTKLELLGQRQRMSELIASSLSNVRELKHGTTLNVSDELTITVVHEALPKKQSFYRWQKDLSFPPHFGKMTPPTSNPFGFNGNIQYNASRKFKRKQGSDPVERAEKTYTEKRRKVTPNGQVSNNNSIAYSNCVKGLQSSGRQTQRPDANKYVQVITETKQSSSDDDSEDEGKGKDEKVRNDEEVDEENDEEEENPDQGDDEEEEVETEGVKVGEDEEKEKDNEEEESSDDDSSSSDSDDDSASEEEEAKSEEVEQAEGNEEEEEEEVEEEGSVSGGSPSSSALRPDSSLSRTSQDTQLQHQQQQHQPPPPPPPQPQHQQQKHQTKGNKSTQERKQIVKEANVQVAEPEDHQLTGDEVNPQMAEAMLMQSPLATSLLQSFLATSLWLGQQDTPRSQPTPKPKHQVPEDMTSETLAVAAGSTKDKKKRQELKNTGQSYINTKGKLVDAKRVWPQDCSRCPLKCNARISEDERLKIFAEYWGLADYNLQREYLAAHMQREEKLGPSGLLRTVILYFLTRANNTKLQVCRQFFLKTLDVSEKASRIVLEKMVRGELGNEAGGTNTPPPTSSSAREREERRAAKSGGEVVVKEEDIKSEESW